MNSEAIAAAIGERNRVFEQCFNARDASGLVAAYFVNDADRPMASPPGGQPPVVGRAGLISMFDAGMQMTRCIQLATVELFVSGEMAHEMGRATLSQHDGSTVFGRYCVLWRACAEGWRAQLDFFTDDGWP